MEPVEFAQGIKGGFPYGNQVDDFTFDQYRKTAAKFTKEVISLAWEMLLEEWEKEGTRPSITEAKGFLHSANRLINPVERDYLEKNPLQDAREYLSERLPDLKKHGAYNFITPDNLRANLRLTELIVERAWIQSQVICGCERIGFDSDKAFGYNSWSKNKAKIFNELGRLKGLALERSKIYFDVESEATDFFNNLEDYDQENMSQMSLDAFVSSMKDAF